MEHYLQFYLKFQAYAIAIGTIVGSLLVSVKEIVDGDFDMPMEQLYDFRFLGHVSFVFSALWLCVGISFFYGVYKKSKKFFYPFVAFYMLDLFLLVVRDIILIWKSKSYYYFIFLNPIAAVITLCLTLHLMLTVVAVSRHYEHDPEARAGTNFVRFKTDSNQQSSNTNQFENAMSEEGSVGTEGVY